MKPPKTRREKKLWEEAWRQGFFHGINGIKAANKIRKTRDKARKTLIK